MKFRLALIASKITYFLIKYFYPGSGGTWPGHVALTLDPAFLSNSIITFPKGIFVVSGTNGKTTTSKLITHFLEQNSYKVTHNRSGGNMLNGVVSAIIRDTSFSGSVKTDVGVFEVDELHMVQLLKHLTPSVVVLLNLSRDQLDRYGEIDVILDKWKALLQKLPSSTNLILDSNTLEFRELPFFFSGKSYFFDHDSEQLAKTQMFGEFNAKNVNAAILAVKYSQLSIQVTDAILSSFEVAYGRGEMLAYKGIFFQVFLAKNPASFNYNLSTIIGNTEHIDFDTILIILNDELRDGRDVSWIYDIDSSKLQDACANKNIFVSGNRCLDMAIRLQYAQIPINTHTVDAKLDKTLQKISNLKPTSVLVLPNYSAMLAFRKQVTGKEIL